MMRLADLAAGMAAGLSLLLRLEGKLAGREPQSSLPASLQPDQERDRDRGQPACPVLQDRCQGFFPKWDNEWFNSHCPGFDAMPSVVSSKRTLRHRCKRASKMNA